MLRLPKTPLLAFAVCFLAGSLAAERQTGSQLGGAQDPEASGASTSKPRLPVSEAAPSWKSVVERDESISFTRRSGHDARSAIFSGDLGSSQLGAALLAIGCTEPQMVRERPLLESYAEVGTDQERRAALLALGEFGEGSEAALQKSLQADDATTRGCAMLGLLLTRRPSGRLQIERLASGTSADARLASELLVFHADALASRPNAVTELYLELRWQAAREYGLVDGSSWSMRAIKALIEDPRFIKSLVLRSISDSEVLGVKDHLLSLLIANGGNAELKAAATAMPDELAALIESGLWKPQGARSWRLLLDHIDEEGIEHRSLALLSLALEVPAVEIHALMLLSRVGLPEPLVDLELDWENLDARDRRLACEAWALAEDPEALRFLAEFEQDPNPGVRAAVMLAEARLGDIEAHSRMKLTLEDPSHEEYAATLEAAMDQSAAPLIRNYLEELLPDLEGLEHTRVARALAHSGVAKGRQALAMDLVNGFPSGKEGVLCVRALVGRDASAHIDLFRKHFPVEKDLALNIALARAIVEAQDDLGLRFLRPALWDSPFDLSMLAAQVIVSSHGLYGLRDELLRAPVEASEKDLRRVGFALGEWGGIQEVELLRRQLSLQPRSPALQGAILGALGRRTH